LHPDQLAEFMYCISSLNNLTGINYLYFIGLSKKLFGVSPSY